MSSPFPAVYTSRCGLQPLQTLQRTWPGYPSSGGAGIGTQVTITKKRKRIYISMSPTVVSVFQFDSVSASALLNLGETRVPCSLVRPHSALRTAWILHPRSLAALCPKASRLWQRAEAQPGEPQAAACTLLQPCLCESCSCQAWAAGAVSEWPRQSGHWESCWPIPARPLHIASLAQKDAKPALLFS